MNQNRQDTSIRRTADSPPPWLDVVHEKVESLRFGVVQIIVHDSKVVQIERTEKTRMDLSCSSRNLG
jgi:hypothetical protein